jgi:hypothetical protein
LASLSHETFKRLHNVTDQWLNLEITVAYMHIDYRGESICLNLSAPPILKIGAVLSGRGFYKHRIFCRLCMVHVGHWASHDMCRNNLLYLYTYLYAHICTASQTSHVHASSCRD